jgi:dihydropteroate synthase
MFTLNCKGKLLLLDKPVVMGIINVTPDSFFSGSRINEPAEVLRKAEKMLNEGASILDIGGQSTRPASTRISTEEELKRVIQPIAAIHNYFPEAIISIDTFYAAVAKEAVAAGASMVNDISAGKMDETMIATVASLRVPYILMHMKGTPETMQQNPDYEDVTREVLDFLIFETNALKKKGVFDIIIDPGIGFGKTIEHNFELLRHLSVFKILDRPILVGVSRKSTIWKTLGITAEEALNGTTVLNTVALMNGCSILRVHDVKEAAEAVKLFAAMRSSEK